MTDGHYLQHALHAWLRHAPALLDSLHAEPVDGLVCLDPAALDQVWVGGGIGATLGRSTGDGPTDASWWHAQLSPADRARVRLAATSSDGSLGGEPADLLILQHRDGSTLRLRWRGQRWQSANLPTLIVVALTRIRPNVDLELRSVVDDLPILAWTCNAQGACDYVNRAVQAYTGRTNAQLRDRQLLEVLHPDDVAAATATWQIWRNTDAELRTEVRIRRHDGVYRWFEHHARRIADDGLRVRWLGTSIDVEARHAQEDAARLRGQQPAVRAAEAPYALFTLVQRADGTVHIPLASPAVEAIYGFSAAELAASVAPMVACIHPDDAPTIRLEGRDARHATTPWTARYRYRHPRLGERVLESHATPEHAHGELRWHAIIRDVSYRYRARAQEVASGNDALPRAPELLLPEVFWAYDALAGQIAYVSPSYEDIWGQSCAALYADPRAWMNFILDDDRPRVEAAFDGLPAGGEFDLEYRLRRSDGTLRWIRDRAYVVLGEAGTVARVIGIAVDISSQRLAAEQWRHGQKMEALGNLAGGFVHDFNNLLWVIAGNSSLLLSDPEIEGLSASVRDSLDDIKVAAERATTLTRQLLTFAQSEALGPAEQDLNQIASETVQLLRRILGSDLNLQLRITSTPVTVHADRNMLEQVLVTLAVNARATMPNGGDLTIGTSIVTLPSGTAEAGDLGRRGRYARLEITDTGSGISAEARALLPDASFPARPGGRRGSLGLAVVADIMKRHLGWVDVECTPGVGTTVAAYLPLRSHA